MADTLTQPARFRLHRRDLPGSPDTCCRGATWSSSSTAAFGTAMVAARSPPCQAYSLVGRARNKGIADYDPEQDHRHTLYEQYLRLLDQVKPAIFVMENVKGILSAKLESKGGRIFDVICEDFRKRGYRLHSLGHAVSGDTFDRELQPGDFLLRAEDYGIPQARHRVILVGLHEDFLRKIPGFKAGDWRLKPLEAVPVKTVLRGMPKLRSGVSRRGKKEHGGWEESILSEIRSRIHAQPLKRELLDAAHHLLKQGCGADGQGGDFVPAFAAEISDPRMEKWLSAPWLGGMANHEARGHMPSDLVRYLFCANFSKEHGRSPTLQDFPTDLLPDHANASDAAAGQGVFADRFRVQVWNKPATTVTAHISKDGHYFIHPDPKQCRSLTVREAARLQTFPDDYLFQGPRTEQYRQVGNAVPPLLANQIAQVLHRMILAAWPDA